MLSENYNLFFYCTSWHLFFSQHADASLLGVIVFSYNPIFTNDTHLREIQSRTCENRFARLKFDSECISAIYVDYVTRDVSNAGKDQHPFAAEIESIGARGREKLAAVEN